MTILPKKKQNNSKNTNEDKVENDRSERYANYGHHSHSRGHSPTNRWNINTRNDEKRSANDSDSQLDSGPTHSKRRHRQDNIRTIIRKNKSVSNVVVNNEVVVDVDNESDGAKCADNSDVEVAINEGNRSDSPSGYNSGDEYEKPPEMWSKEEWDEKEKHFDKKLRKKGFTIKKMSEDGACLFRAVGLLSHSLSFVNCLLIVFFCYLISGSNIW